MHRFLAAFWVALLAVPSLHAQTNPVSEAEFFSAVDEHHPYRLALQEEVGRARARLLDATTWADPEMAVEREDPAGSAEQLELTLAWRPVEPGRRFRTAAAEHDLAAAEARLEGQSLALHVTLHRVYAEWALAEVRADRLAAHASRLSELARRERARADRGESSGLEARRLALAASEADSHAALAKAEAASALTEVRAWAPAIAGDAVPELPHPAPMPDSLRGPHPELSALTRDLEASRSSVRAADRIVGWPELKAGWQRQELEVGSVDGPILGFAWTLPVFDRNRAERSLSAAREQAAEARLASTRQRLVAEREGAMAAYLGLGAAAREAVEATEDSGATLAGAVAAFEHGEASVTDLLDTLRSTLDAGLSALEVRAAALAAFRRLEEVAGHPLENESHRTPGDTR